MLHAIQPAPAPGRFATRATGIVLALLLQAGAVWALVSGLTIQKVIDFVKPPVVVTLDRKTDDKPPEPQATEAKPVEVFVPIPTVTYSDPPQGGGGTALTPDGPGKVTALQGDHGPMSLMATHTTPPYPPMALRLGLQGTVTLRLTVGADGGVLEAQVTRSSGDESLDRAAREWVIRHWRYKPAIRGGVAVPAAVDVAVKFDLKNAG